MDPHTQKFFKEILETEKLPDRLLKLYGRAKHLFGYTTSREFSTETLVLLVVMAEAMPVVGDAASKEKSDVRSDIRPIVPSGKNEKGRKWQNRRYR